MLSGGTIRLNGAGLLGLGALAELIDSLARGACVVVPADTGYMFAVDALAEGAIRRLYEIKGRPPLNPIPVAVASLRQAEPLVHIGPRARRVMERFMPGPLTVVMRKKECVPDLLVAHTGNLGIRVPNSPAVLQLCAELGKPLTATSVNRAGEPPIHDAAAIVSRFGARIDLLVEANAFEFTRPSTVVRMTGDELEIVREGPISAAAIAAAAG